MKLPLWFDNPACKAGGPHCPTCRKKIGGRLWRDRLRNAFTIPDTDFECPHGEAWRGGDAPTCDNCHGSHATDECPIPPDFDGNYHNDSKGTAPCNC